ncbi:L-ascorbate metabolism protein UlaG, beta-lactamase superfamily [Rhizobium sp. NFR03]|nr:L-ascorbate metabolism protein UlaG, beta-lactamase superfamily [Rhizobium sp. NFR03]
MKRRTFFKWSLAGAVAVLSGGFTARSSMAANRYYKGPVSDHFDGTRFFNPGGVEPNGFGDLLRWQFNGQRASWPEKPDPRATVIKPDLSVTGQNLRVTMVGHASMLIQVAGLNILTDPVWSERASPVSFAGPRRVSPPGIRLEDLPRIDVVLISHNHYDHLDITTIASLEAANKPTFVTPLGNDIFIRKAAPDARITLMDWGDALDVTNGISINCEPAHHWSARGLGDRRKALWAAFVISTPAGRIYHIGDTGFHDGINYRAAGKKYGGFRLAILPIGAYEPRWFMKGQHQNPNEAIEGMLLAKAAYVVGHHFATIQLTDEAMDAPERALDAALAKHKVDPARVRPLHAGEVFDVPPERTPA